VPHLVDQFLSVIHENWSIVDHPTSLPAYALWRLNWIHPFVEGNGRTARAACYLLICLRAGMLLPGKKIVPERIRENRAPYYEALRAADRHWEDGQFNVSALADYLAGLLQDQVNDRQVAAGNWAGAEGQIVKPGVVARSPCSWRGCLILHSHPGRPPAVQEDKN